MGQTTLGFAKTADLKNNPCRVEDGMKMLAIPADSLFGGSDRCTAAAATDRAFVLPILLIARFGAVFRGRPVSPGSIPAPYRIPNR